MPGDSKCGEKARVHKKEMRVRAPCRGQDFNAVGDSALTARAHSRAHSRARACAHVPAQVHAPKIVSACAKRDFCVKEPCSFLWKFNLAAASLASGLCCLFGERIASLRQPHHKLCDLAAFLTAALLASGLCCLFSGRIASLRLCCLYEL